MIFRPYVTRFCPKVGIKNYRFEKQLQTWIKLASKKSMATKRKSENNSESHIAAKSAKPNSGHWAMKLTDSMNDPNLKIKEDHKVVIIKDKYPKATFHYLILPKEDIPSLKSVTKVHVDLLKHMEQEALILSKEDKHKKYNFKMGYHASPSMQRLHLHLISTDMNSECLKTKKHWNSFNSDFFLHSKDVIEELEKNGRVKSISNDETKRLMSLPLKCNICDSILKNMPLLKKHLLTHLK